MNEIQFNDIDSLREQISDEYGDWSLELMVSQEMINQFADLTGDHQWIHTDVERAKAESPFGATVAHGYLILSLLPTLKRPSLYRLVGHRNVVNYGSNGLRFLSPVVAGSALRARQRLRKVEVHRRGTLITVEAIIHTVGNEKPALRYDMEVLYME